LQKNDVQKIKASETGGLFLRNFRQAGTVGKEWMFLQRRERYMRI